MKIQCIIFDFGGVIGYPHDKERVKTMAELVQMKVEDFEEAYFYHRTAYDEGLINKEEYWQRISGKDLDSVTLEALVTEDYHSWTRINQKVVELIKRLRTTVGHVALLSNINMEAKRYIQEELKLFEIFHSTYCSCDLKLMKPHREIYDYVIHSLQVPAEECVFIDDTKENIAGAKKAGLHGIVFDNYEQLKTALEQYHISV
ncbi:HAD family phosphatase [Vallitaleaceae bacterium 9-2]